MSIGLIEARLMSIVTSTEARPGELLFDPYQRDLSLVIALEQQNWLLKLGRFQSFHEVRFPLQPAALDHSPQLKISDWRLEVDPERASLPTADRARTGDAFFNGETTGIVGTHNHSTFHVSLEGARLSPDWANYVGFRKWRITVPDSPTRRSIFDWDGEDQQ